EQNISMLLGIVVVILVGSLLYNYFKSVNQKSTGDTSSTASPEQVVVPSGDQLPADYIVQSGDTLWSISVKAYGSGYNWTDVFAANRDVIGNNSNRLLAGSKINLPDVAPKVLAAQTTTPKEPIQYEVKAGDNLWKVLVANCQNGYLWSKVAKANNLANANQIEVGQKLTLSCN
ncbi:MAG: LysM peptidoglycan-binding domain-containing protein, partial [bacterium]|nr:LysM peptidoglycan-binding domain-containing protein [bacterium]